MKDFILGLLVIYLGTTLATLTVLAILGLLP